MPSVDTETDNAADADTATGASDGAGGGLEHRIDELLKDVEHSLDSLDRTGDLEQAAQSAERAAEQEFGAPDAGDAPGVDSDQISMELDGALRDADQAIEEGQAPEVASDSGASAIDELDAALAEAAEAAEQDVAHASSMGGGFGEPAKMTSIPAKKPTTRVETLTEPTMVLPVPPARPVHADAPHPEDSPAGGSEQGVEPESGETPSDTEAARPSAARAPVAHARRVGVVERGLRIVSSPLALMSPAVRDLIGWVGLTVLFNAVCVWVFVVIMGPHHGATAVHPKADGASAPVVRDSATGRTSDAGD